MYPNARDCEHGQLRRACNVCELEREIGELQMTASEDAKKAGLKSLQEAAAMVGKPANTLQNWYRDSPVLFRAVILGCAQIKRERQGLTPE